VKTVAVSGGRDYKDSFFVNVTMSRLLRAIGPFRLIEGGAPGLDRLCREWAKAKGLPYTTVHAQWHIYRKRAGDIRNAKMVAMEPDLAIVFPGGDGTMNFYGHAKEQGVPIWIPATQTTIPVL
jgi:hypothetical protein